MAKRPATTDVGNILTSATTINQNYDAIDTAFDNTLSRDGSTPNEMLADLDLNSNDILNVGTIQVQDITVSGGSVTGVIAIAEQSAAAAQASAVDSAASAAAAATFDPANFQPIDAGLTSIASLTTSVDKLPYSTGLDTYALTDFTAFARTLLDDTNAAQARATLELGAVTASQNSPRQFAISNRPLGIPFLLTMPAPSTGPSSMLVNGVELDIKTPSDSQVPDAYWLANDPVTATIFPDHVQVEPRPRYVDLDGFTAYYNADGQYSVSARIETNYDTIEKLEYVGAGVVPLPRPFEPINWKVTFADRASSITPPVRAVSPRIIADFVSDVFVELWREDGSPNFASGDKAYIDLAGKAEWYPRVERRLTSDNELFGYYNPSWSSYTTPVPTGTASGNVMQAHFIDFPNDRLFVIQKDGTTAYIRAFVASTGAQLYGLPVTGAAIHTGLHVDGEYFWCGGAEGSPNTNPTIYRVLRSDFSFTTLQFNPVLSGLPGAQSEYSSNVTHSVDEANNLIAIRVKRSGINYILIGSWSAFKANSTTWVADHTFIPTASQGAEIFQGIAIKDGAVMVLTGFSQRQGEKWLISYDFQGRTLDRRCLEIGRDATDKYEPQGLNIYSDGTNEYLTAYFATGVDGANNHKLFRTTKSVL